MAQFLKWFIPASLFLLLGLYLLDHRNETVLRIEAKSRSAVGVRLESQIMANRLQGRSLETLTVADLVGHDLEHHPSFREASPHLAKFLQRFLHHHPEYLRAQLLFADGAMEVRVDRGEAGEIKKFINEIPTPAAAEVFRQVVSRGQCQVKLDPVILPERTGPYVGRHPAVWRLATSFKDPVEGRQVAVLVYLSVYELLERLRAASQIMGGKLYLTNMHGQWLLGPDYSVNQKAWGAKPKEPDARDGLRQTWGALTDQTNGQFENQDGLFSFATVAIGRTGGRKDGGPVTGPPFLKLMHHTFPEEMRPLWLFFTPWTVPPALLLLAALVWVWAATKRRRAEAERALRKSEQTVLAISRAVRDAVILVDGADRVQFWNPAAASMFGYRREEVMGQLVNMLRSPEDEEQAPAGLEYVARRYDKQHNGSLRRYIARRKDGREFPVEINISSLVLDGQRFVVGIIRDISQRQEIEHKLLEMATTDALTGLCNRRRFLEMAEQELSRSKRYGHCLAMMMLDLDLFKQVNDTYGHQVGDEVLKNLAEVGSACLRRVDLMGRVGGEEFAVLLPETDLEAALPVAERLRQAVEYSCVHLPEGEVCCTVSIGVAQSTPQSELSLEALLKLADDALYAAKNAGRNRVFTAGGPVAAKQASEPAKDRSG